MTGLREEEMGVITRSKDMMIAMSMKGNMLSEIGRLRTDFVKCVYLHIFRTIFHI